MFDFKARLRNQIISLALIVAMIAAVFPFATIDAYGIEQEKENEPVVTGLTYYGEPIIRGFSEYDGYMGTEYPITYFYSDGYFMKDTSEYNNHLASMSMILAMAAMKFNNSRAVNLLTNIGCKNISGLNNGYSAVDSIGVTIGTKKLSDGSILVPIVVRGGDYRLEWCNNFVVGTEGDSNGFSDSAKDVIDFANEYIADKKIELSKVKFWLTGYSRGAAVANVAAKILTDNLSKNQVYAYSFETPQAAYNNTKSYGNIFCIKNYNDFITEIVPSYMGFDVYGSNKTVFADTSKTDFITRESEMKEQLSLISDSVDNYISGSQSIDYAAIDLNINAENIADIFNNKFQFIKSTGKKGTQKEVVSKAIKIASGDGYKPVLENRWDYASNVPEAVNAAAQALKVDSYTVEEVVTKCIAYYINDEIDIDALMDNFKNFDYIKNGITLINTIYYIRYGKLPTLYIKGYKGLVKDLWEDLDTDSGDYKRISKFLNNDQVNDLKRALPIVLYTVSKYFSQDYNGSPQTVGTIVNNLDTFIQNHYPDVNYSWLRLEDSYYNNESMHALDSTTQIETNISGKAFDGTTITVKNTNSDTLAVIEDGDISNVNSGSIYISSAVDNSGIKDLSIWSSQALCIEVESDSATEIDATELSIDRRMYSKGSEIQDCDVYGMRNEAINYADLKLYKDQTAIIKASSDKTSIEKNIGFELTSLVNGRNFNNLISSEIKNNVITLTYKEKISDCITIKWMNDDKQVGEGLKCTLNLEVDEKNLDIVAVVDTKHKMTYHEAKKSSFKENGWHEYYLCETCKDLFLDEDGIYVVDFFDVVIPKITDTKLSTTSYVYNGTSKKPKVTVRAGNDVLKEGIDFKLKYSNNKNVGTGSVVITGIGNYSSNKTLTFKINPKNTSIKSLVSAKKALTVKWNPIKTPMSKSKITGYQVQYSLYKTFKSPKTVKVKGYSKSSVKLKLKSKKKYYARIRTYMTVGKKTYYSSWSKAKYKTTK